MSNMGYCRFENTLSDLLDCYEHIQDRLSESERRARKELIELCEQIAAEYADSPIAFEEDGERPFECEHCGYETRKRDDIERHYEVEHEDEYEGDDDE